MINSILKFIFIFIFLFFCNTISSHDFVVMTMTPLPPFTPYIDARAASFRIFTLLMSLGFTGMGFLTKTIGMIFLTWFGVGYLELDFRIFVPLLTFFWFFTHVVEAFVIQHYMKQNESEYIKSIQR